MGSEMQHNPDGGRPYVFVSYASADRDRVLPIVAALRRAGVPVWIDQSGIPGGANYGAEINDGIKGATALVLLCTPASLASRNVRQEILLGWRHQRPYLPLMLDLCAFPEDIAYWLEGSQWVEVLDKPEAMWLPQALAALQRVGIGGTPEGDAPPLPASGIADAPPMASAGETALPEPPSLFGREREQATLRERLSSALGGQGGLVLIGGEAGVGKTALIESLAYDATMHGALVRVGRCYDLTETPSYGPAGQYEDGDAHSQASLALADACHVPYERALTLLAVAEARAARGKAEAARTLLDAIRAICEPLGAKPALARAGVLAARFTPA
ncbi:MAG: toll/interleukin-1 receptor domain-containing protein [Chloroflexota bacterium]|nr:toll/interleukin-1 receptor domain-containing protein [Chloroflexota bacterium]